MSLFNLSLPAGAGHRFPYLVGLLAFSSISAAAEFTVTTELDTVDINPGNGVCQDFIPGRCSLRAAIMEANALDGLDVIVFDEPLHVTLTIAGANEAFSETGDLDVRDDLAIIALSPTPPVIDANGIDRALQVFSFVDFFRLDGITITNGATDGFGGGLDSAAEMLEVVNSRFVLNRAERGGGINVLPATGQAMIRESEFTQNVLRDPDANDFSSGSAMYLAGNTEVERSTIYSNFGLAESILPTIRRPAIFANSTNNVTPITVNIRNSTIWENSAGVHGERLFLGLRNVNITENGQGLTFVRLPESAPDADSTQLRVRNSFIGDNDSGSNCDFNGGIDVVNINNYNATSGTGCGMSGGSTNLLNVNPGFATELSDNGGRTLTLMMSANSPLVDAGHPAEGALGCEENDQRGVDRPLDGDGNGDSRCDIGPLEITPEFFFMDGFE